MVRCGWNVYSWSSSIVLVYKIWIENPRRTIPYAHITIAAKLPANVKSVWPYTKSFPDFVSRTGYKATCTLGELK